METYKMTVREAEAKVDFDIVDHMDLENLDEMLSGTIEIVVDGDRVRFLSLPTRDTICEEPLSNCPGFQK